MVHVYLYVITVNQFNLVARAYKILYFEASEY